MKVQIRHGCKCAFTLTFILFFNIIRSSARDPVIIGTSNRSDATAFNNARKIVRTSDGRRFVVFQDSVNSQSVVKWTYSDDGFLWSEPQILANGTFPAIAVSKDDWIYVVWSSYDKNRGIYGKYLEKGSLDWQDGYLLTGGYPSVDAVEEYIHIASQSPYDTSRIFIQRYDKYLSWGDGCYVDDDTLISERPSIAGDIEYNGNSIHVLWTNFWDKGQQSHIVHAYFDEDIEMWYLNDVLKRDTLSYSNNCVYPSFSLRYERGLGDFLIIGSSRLNNSGMALTYAGYYIEDEYMNFTYQTSYETTGLSLPSVDDLSPHYYNCAIVWQDSGEIIYGQTDFSDIYDESISQISDTNEQRKMYPSICYKTFRADTFDVVWTEGNEPPYTIKYCRKPKWPTWVYIKQDTLKAGTYKKDYYTGLSAIGGIQPCDWSVLSGSFPQGIEMYDYGDWCAIAGKPMESGHFIVTVCVTDSREVTQSDTSTFDLFIKNTNPQLVSPDSISVEIGSDLAYFAQAQDPEENDIEYTFSQYPSWLTPDGPKLSGMVPSNAEDTSFVVIVSDGDMADTMQVKVHIQEESGIVLQKEPALPEKYSLSQNFPNPFNASTTIAYALPQQSLLDISVYDINGQLVQVLFKGTKEAGAHEMIWDASNLPSGVYCIRMRAGEFTHYKKCTLLK